VPLGFCQSNDSLRKMINDILNYDKNWFDFNSPTLNTHLFGKSFPDYLLDIN